MILDPWGVHGYYLVYGTTIFFTGIAFVLFLHFWWKKKLDFDEEAKEQMMGDND